MTNRYTTQADVIEQSKCYQFLFDLMQQEHNLILTISEMDEIIIACEKVKENIEQLNLEDDD